MKKEYVSPRVDIIYLMMEEEMLAGSKYGGHLPGGPDGAKAYDFDQNDFSGESLWNDEIDGNNE